MPNTRPGDLVYVSQGTYLRSAVDNEERWSEGTAIALVIGSARRYVEVEDDVTALVTVFISGIGMYFVEESSLMTPDEFSNPARLFPLTRLREG